MTDFTTFNAVIYNPVTGAIRMQMQATMAQIEANCGFKDWTPESPQSWADTPITAEAYLITPEPIDTLNKQVVDGEIVDVDDLMFRLYDEHMSDLRFRRNSILRNSDWVELPSALDRLGSDLVQAWLDYRQALRDLTDSPPEDIMTWPVDPDGGQ